MPYGGYWIVLAESYYKEGDYQKCFDSICAYEDMGIGIYRYDYEYARVLPLAIESAKHVLSSDKFYTFAYKRVQEIRNNTETNNWALRYYAAIVLGELYRDTKNKEYLSQAYYLTLDIANNLVQKQLNMNNTYMAPILKANVKKDSSSEEKKQIEEYNMMLQEKRKVELAPAYEPLELVCNLLSIFADKLEISADERNKMNKILHPDGQSLFLITPIELKYNYSLKPADINPQIEFLGDQIVVPVQFVSEDVSIIVSSITESGIKHRISDWKISKVTRDSNAIESFKATFVSEDAKKHRWENKEMIEITIYPSAYIDTVYTMHMVAEYTKQEFLDYFKVWEGYRNYWYDYLGVWNNSIQFVPKD